MLAYSTGIFIGAIKPTFYSTILPLLSAPAPPPPNSSSLTLKADATDDLVVFKIAMSDVAILLKL